MTVKSVPSNDTVFAVSMLISYALYQSLRDLEIHMPNEVSLALTLCQKDEPFIFTILSPRPVDEFIGSTPKTASGSTPNTIKVGQSVYDLREDGLAEKWT